MNKNSMSEKGEIASMVRKLEDSYINDTVKKGKYVDYSMHETIERINAYCANKHISGSQDSLGRDKPFSDIVTTAVNTRDRATDLDTKQLRILPRKESQILLTDFANVLLKDWMRRQRFGKFLNKWGYALAKYNSSVVKFVEKGGELIPEVVPWERLIVDPININQAPVIEKLYLTESELKNKGYTKEMVAELLDAKTTRKTADKSEVDNNKDYIEVYEVHGEMELSYLTGKEQDDDTYVQQMHVISFFLNDKKEYEDFTLYKGKEAQSPYLLTHLFEDDERTLSRGVVEQLFDSQWMVNHFSKASKDLLDFSSKLGFQTTDTSFVGENALDTFEIGDILVTKPNSSLTPLNTTPYADGSLLTSKREWEQTGVKISGVTEAMMGSAKAGAAWRQVDALLQESHDLFEKMQENKALYLEEMARTFIIPFLKKKLDTKDEILAMMESEDIDKIDAIYVPKIATKKFNEQVINDVLATGFSNADYEQQKQDVQAEMSQMGNVRSFAPSEVGDKTWKEVLKDFEWDIIVDVTGESVDLQSNISTLATVLQTIVNNPAALENPDARMVFNSLLTASGTVSPLQITSAKQATQQQGQSQNIDANKLKEITPAGA